MSCLPRSQLADVESAETTTLLRKIKKKNLLIPYTQRSIPPPITNIQADSLTVSSVSTCSHNSNTFQNKKVEQLGKNVRIMHSLPQEHQQDSMAPQRPPRKGYSQWHREAPIPEDMPLSTSLNDYRDDHAEKNGDTWNSNLSEHSGSDESSRQEPPIRRSRLMNSKSGFSSRTPITKNPPDKASRIAMERDNISSTASRRSTEINDDESDLISREDDIISAAMSRKSQKSHRNYVTIETCFSGDLVSREDEIRSAAASRASHGSSNGVIKNIQMIASDDIRNRKDCTSSKISVLSDPILQNRSSEERNPSPTRSHHSCLLNTARNQVGYQQKTRSARFDRYSSCQESVFSELSDVSASISTKVNSAPAAQTNTKKHISFQKEPSSKGMQDLTISEEGKSSTDALIEDDQILATEEMKSPEKEDEKGPRQERSLQNEISEFLDSLSVISSNSIFALAKHLRTSVEDAVKPVEQHSSLDQPRNASTGCTDSGRTEASKQNKNDSKRGIHTTTKATGDNGECKSTSTEAAKTRETNHVTPSSRNNSTQPKSMKSSSKNLDAQDSQNERLSFYDSVQSDVSDVSEALSEVNEARMVRPSDQQKITPSGSDALSHNNHVQSIVRRSRLQNRSRAKPTGLYTLPENLGSLISESSNSNSSANLSGKRSGDIIAANSPINLNDTGEGKSSQKYHRSLNDEDDGVSDLSSVSAFLSQKSRTRRGTRQVVPKNRFCLQKRDPPTLSEEIEEEEEEEEVVHDTISDVSSVSAQLRLSSKKINVGNFRVNPAISDITESCASESWNLMPIKNASYRERNDALINERVQSQASSLQARSVLPIVNGLDVTPQEETVPRRRSKTSKRFERRSSSESSGQRADPGKKTSRRKGATAPQVVDNIPRRQTVDPPVAIRISRDPSVSSKSTRTDRNER